MGAPGSEPDLLIVPVDAQGERIDRYLAQLRPDCSRARLQALITQGDVHLDGHPVRPSERLRPGQVIALNWPDLRPSLVEPQAIPLQVVFEDASLLVVNKPAGMVTHPAPGSRDGTLVNALLAHCSDLSGIGGVERPGIVHRLDKDTTGLLVVAKTDAAHRSLSAQIAAKTAQRCYLGVVTGSMSVPQGRIDAPIRRHPRDRIKMAVVPEGRTAATRWEVLETFRDATLLRLSLETGRTHQIRVHMAHLGHPLVGDPLYGPSKPFAIRMGRQALHAEQLGFRHPVSGEAMRFQADPPADFQRLLMILRLKNLTQS